MSYAPPPPPGPPPPPYINPYGGYGPPPPPIAPMPHPPRRGGSTIIGTFIGALVGVAVLVGIVVFLNQPPPPPSCPEGQLCPVPPPATLAPRSPGPSGSFPNQTPQATVSGGPLPSAGQSPQPTPASNAAPFVGGKVWRSQALAYSFEYDPGLWTLGEEDDAFAQLLLGPVEVDVIGYPSSMSVDGALEDALKQTDNFLIGRAPNTRSYDALLGPGIGYVRGKGAVFSATFKNPDGTPGDSAGMTIMAATKGNATVVIVVLVENPDKAFGSGTLQLAARREVDSIVKTFLWEGGGG